MASVRRLPFVAGCALGLLLSCPGLFAEPVVITVRIIDARNGKPYRKLRLRVDLLRAEWSPQGYRTDAEARANLMATKLGTTNDKGEITLDLPAPLPGEISIDTGPTACGPGYFDTRAVIEAGVVGENQCKTKLAKLKVNFRAKRGEIVYFATHVGFFERMLTK
jgi:hypothetical protein